MKIPCLFQSLRNVVMTACGLLILTPVASEAEDGTSLAKEALNKLESLPENTTEADMLEFQENLRKDVTALSQPKRIEFLYATIREKETDSKSEGVEKASWMIVTLFNWSGASREDWALAACRFYETGTPEDDQIAERWIRASGPSQSAKGDDLAVFRPALEHASGPSRRKIVHWVFMRYPAAAAEWFAKNTILAEAERARLLEELPAVWFMAEPPEHYPGQPVPDQLLSKEEIGKKTGEWLADDSWILRMFVKSYLTKFPQRQTPEWKVAMEKVMVPDGVKLRPK